MVPIIIAELSTDLKFNQGDWVIDLNSFKKAIFTFSQKRFNFNDGAKLLNASKIEKISDEKQFQEMLWIFALL